MARVERQGVSPEGSTGADTEFVTEYGDAVPEHGVPDHHESTSSDGDDVPLKELIEREYAAGLADAEDGDSPDDGEGDRREGGQDAGGDDTPEPMEAPAHWSMKDRQDFAELDPKGQRFLLERHRQMEAAWTRKNQEFSQTYGPLQETMTRWQPYLNQIGAPGAQAIDRLLQTESALRYGTNPQKVQVIKQLIEAYEVGAPGVNDPAPNPELQAMQQQLAMMQNGMYQQQAAAAQAQQARTAEAMRDFAEARDETGALVNPYFGELESTMATIAAADVQAGIQPELNSLYERAMWMHPQVREKVLAARAAHEAAEKQKAGRKARRAGASISGSGSPPSGGDDSIRAILESEYRKQLAA